MKMRIGIIFAVILAGAGALFFFTGKGSGGVTVTDVKAVLANPSTFSKKELRVQGFIKPGSILRYGDKADFVLELEGEELKVHFDGSTQLPDTFADGAPARADGRLNPDRTLVSSKVEAKCASKYEANYAEKSPKSMITPDSVRKL